MKRMIEKLKLRWGIESNFQVIIILIVFAITGSLAVKVAAPVLSSFDVTRENFSAFWYWTFRILLIFPIYQVLLMVVGTLLGQFKFFWGFQKKTVGRMFGKKSV